MRDVRDDATSVRCEEEDGARESTARGGERERRIGWWTREREYARIAWNMDGIDEEAWGVARGWAIWEAAS